MQSHRASLLHRPNGKS